ncbi:Kynurenine aminotransferase [Dirofilaria immitis]
MASILRSAGMKPIIPDSGYFMVADFSQLDGPFKVVDGSNDPLDFRFVRWMCREKNLAMIPNSAFYSGPNKQGNDHFIRVCFFKSNKLKISDAKQSSMSPLSYFDNLTEEIFTV